MNTPTKCSCLNKAKKAYPVESVNSSSIKGILEIPGIRTSVTTSAFDSPSKNEKNIEFLKIKMKYFTTYIFRYFDILVQIQQSQRLLHSVATDRVMHC